MAKKALFIGRWQPFHNGHNWLIRQKLDKGIPCIVAVRDIPRDEKNPLDTWQVLEILREAFKGEDVEITVIPDIESVNWGRGVGYDTTEHVPPADIGYVSGTEIRKQIRAGDEAWKQNVPEKAQGVVEHYFKQLERAWA